MTGVSEADRERVRQRLREDYEFFIDARTAAGEGPVKIVTKRGELVTLELKRPQRRLLKALMRQRANGRPQRAIILKARQVGFSTIAQVVAIIRTSQTPNHLALTVAQERKTVAALFKIGSTVEMHLPSQIRPPAPRRRETLEMNYISFMEPSRQLRAGGVMGLNSSYETATAKVAAGARGRTIHTLHFSEIAFYGKDDAVLGIQQGVPALPESLILKESTANGHNWFKDEWDLAEAGESEYYPMFTPWFEEDEYRLAFANDGEMEDFEATVGQGTKALPEIGEDEVELAELIPRKLREWAIEDEIPEPDEEYVRRRTLEHLNWRRWCIVNQCFGKVSKFHQEYPSVPEEAFLSTGRKVFDAAHVRRALDACDVSDPAVPNAEHPGPARGLLRGTEVRKVRPRRGVEIEIPTGALWVPWSKRARGELAEWRHFGAPAKERWQQQPDGSQLYVGPGQYLVNVDPAGGEEDEGGTEHAFHAITVINHRTLELMAVLEVQGDVNELALQTYLAALHWNRALVTVERTGGWGLPVLRTLAFDYKYPRLYEKQILDQRTGDRMDRLGWDTTIETKPLLVARGEKLLLEAPHLVRSRKLAQQMLSYVRDKRGRMKPDSGKHADVLMSWLIGQHIASVWPVRKDVPPDKRRRGRSRPGSRLRCGHVTNDREVDGDHERADRKGVPRGEPCLVRGERRLLAAPLAGRGGLAAAGRDRGRDGRAQRRDAGGAAAAWCRSKVADGWVFGPVKDADAKTHPCLVPYDALPREQQRKDALFVAVVNALTDTL
jgi:hypothetical protein